MMIKIENLSKAYGDTKVLDDISFSVNQGEILGLFGPNGTGKSTLLKILALITKADQGSYYWNSQNALKNIAKIRPKIGFVPQEIALFEELTVWDNLMCWSRQPKKDAKILAKEISEALMLTILHKKRVRNLSGGMKRRVNLAVALLNKPQLLIMDEPFVGIDVKHMELLIKYLKEQSQKGVTQIISGHHISQLKPLIDTAMLLNNGNMVFLGKVEEAPIQL